MIKSIIEKVIVVAVIGLAGLLWQAYNDIQTIKSDMISISEDNSPNFNEAVLAFNRTTCPTGWSPLHITEGRYIVGLTPSGKLLGTAGVALTNQENRAAGKHDHTYKDQWTGGSGNGLGWGSAQRNSEIRNTGESGEQEGTNAPYVQLLFCEKN